jgi:hypothetical protein
MRGRRATRSMASPKRAVRMKAGMSPTQNGRPKPPIKNQKKRAPNATIWPCARLTTWVDLYTRTIPAATTAYRLPIMSPVMLC